MTTQRQHTIYVIEILPIWHALVAPDLPDGARCFYVGQTAHDVAERYREHRTGQARFGRRSKKTVNALNPIFKAKNGEALVNRRDIALRRTIMKRYPKVTDPDAANKLESQVVDQLRGEGNCVYPKGLGDIPFDEYRDFHPRR